jgi:hypothetical protein
VRNVVDLASLSYFLSKDEPDQWICWDFHGLRIKPTHYTITSHDDSSFMTSWTLHGSVDPSKGWTKLDYAPRYYSYYHDEEPSGTGRSRTFHISTSDPYSVICLTQTGKTGWGFNSLGLCSFEIFGTLLESQE